MLRILFLSCGRRNVVLRSFERAAHTLGVGVKLYVGDCCPELSAACQTGVYTSVRLPRYTDGGYCNFLLGFCKKEKIDLVIPFMDGDLHPLSSIAAELVSQGTFPVVSSLDTIELTTGDKRKTHSFFKTNNIPSPKHTSSLCDLRFPCFMKPYDGIGSKFANRLNHPFDLLYWFFKTPNRMVVEFIGGEEYTVDVYASILTGEPKVAVPRKRLEVRSGEVNKAQTSKNKAIMSEALNIVSKLPFPRGVLTLQCILAEPGVPKFIEINSRFGGGVPISIKAGADFPLWILKEFLGHDPGTFDFDFLDNLYMFRYEEAIYVRGNHVL